MNPLSVAAYEGNINIIRHALHDNCLNIPDCFMAAVAGGNIDTINLLIPYVSQNTLVVCFGLACMTGPLAKVKLILPYINKPNWDECLCFACGSGQLDIISFIIDKGARDFKTALEIAKDYNIPDICFFIKNMLKTSQ